MTNNVDSLTTSLSCLYEIVGVLKTATSDEIKKAYRVRALQCHPDKDPSPEAKLNFQKLLSAYTVLKDSESRALYDETGFVEGEGFDKAADFFRTKFGRISEEDITAFETKYKGSADEIADVQEFYSKHGGDLSKLLEWIPLSEPNEVDRFLKIVDTLILENSLSVEPLYKPSIPKLRKSAAQMKKEQAKFSKDDACSLANLALSIQAKRRPEASESFFDDLLAKYSTKEKSGTTKKAKKGGSHKETN